MLYMYTTQIQMTKNNLAAKTTQTVLKVLSQTKESVRVKFPNLEVPVIMTNKYFNYLKGTGTYMFIYCVGM